MQARKSEGLMNRRIDRSKFRKILRNANDRLRGDLLFYLDAFMEQTGIAETRISREAGLDNAFFKRVRQGGYASPPGYDKAVEWMDLKLEELAAEERRKLLRAKTRTAS